MKTIFTMLLAVIPLSASSDSRPTPVSADPALTITTRAESRAIPAVRVATSRIPESARENRGSAAEDTPAVDLSGHWLLTLPAGFQYRATIDALGEDRYRLGNAVAFNGIYKLHGDVLQLVEPVDQRLNVFDWQLHNVNSMTLVDETGASGADYAGATLGRQIEWEDANLPRKIIALGRPAVPRPRTARAPATTSRETTIFGTAFRDATYGPYVETEETIVFIKGLETWPESVIGHSVSVTGTIRPFLVRDGGETLRAQQLQVASWSPAEDVGPRK